MAPAKLAISTTFPAITTTKLAKHNVPTHIFHIDGKDYACRALPESFQNSEEYVAASRRPDRLVTYYASICGSVISRRANNTLRVIKTHNKPNKYGSLRATVVLYRDGVINNQYVHRCIAAAFCTGRNKRDEEGQRRHMVNHIDENMLNNHAANLEWVSGRTNYRHSAYVVPQWRMERGDLTDSDKAALEVIEDFMAGEMSLATLIEVHGPAEVTRSLRIAGFFTLEESASRCGNEDITYISRKDLLALAI